MTTQLLTFEQAAEICACTVRTLKGAKGLRSIRLGKGAKTERIHPKDLEQFINERRGVRSDDIVANIPERSKKDRNLKVLRKQLKKKH